MVYTNVVLHSDVNRFNAPFLTYEARWMKSTACHAIDFDTGVAPERLKVEEQGCALRASDAEPAGAGAPLKHTTLAYFRRHQARSCLVRFAVAYSRHQQARLCLACLRVWSQRATFLKYGALAVEQSGSYVVQHSKSDIGVPPAKPAK